MKVNKEKIYRINIELNWKDFKESKQWLKLLHALNLPHTSKSITLYIDEVWYEENRYDKPKTQKLDSPQTQ